MGISDLRKIDSGQDFLTLTPPPPYPRALLVPPPSSPCPACPTVTVPCWGVLYLSDLRWAVVLLPGTWTLLLPATPVPTPSTSHKTLCPQTTPTGEKMTTARALDGHLEDLRVTNGWVRMAKGGNWVLSVLLAMLLWAPITPNPKF